MPIDRPKMGFAARAERTAQFDALLIRLWELARAVPLDLPKTPPEGIGEIEKGISRVRYAVSRPHEVATFSLCHPDKDKPSDRINRVEWSTVLIKDFKSLATVAAWTEDRAGHRVAEKSKVRSIWEQLRADRLVSPEDDDGPIASWSELRSLLGVHPKGREDHSSLPRDLERIRALEDEVEYFSTLAREHSDGIRRLQARLRALRESSIDVSGVDADDQTQSLPLTSLADLSTWSVQFDDSLVILPRALQEARKSPYQDVSAVETALRLLAGPYRELKLGLLSHSEFDRQVSAAGLRITPSGGEVTFATNEGYVVRWQGQRRNLEFHIGKGGSRDLRHTLRIYWFWCDETQKVVVGWLPSHLDNSLS